MVIKINKYNEPKKFFKPGDEEPLVLDTALNGTEVGDGEYPLNPDGVTMSYDHKLLVTNKGQNAVVRLIPKTPKAYRADSDRDDVVELGGEQRTVDNDSPFILGSVKKGHADIYAIVTNMPPTEEILEKLGKKPGTKFVRPAKKEKNKNKKK